MFKGVNINKLEGMLGGDNPNTDAHMALVYALSSGDLAGSTVLNTGYQLKEIKDLEDLGFTASHDANKKILVHHHVSEFFRLAPQGTLTLVLTEAGALTYESEAFVPIKEDRDIKAIGLVGFGIDFNAGVNEVEDLQELVDDFSASKRLIDAILIEGEGVLDSTDYFGINSLPDYRAKKAPNISVVIAQDPSIASLESEYKFYAAVGAALGMIAVRQVNENMGSVNILRKPEGKKGTENYPLTGGGRWESASLSDGRPFSSLSFTEQRTLNEKGYIYAGNFEGYEGVYFSGSATCVEMASDYAYIENNRTWNKAARLIRKTLIPLVRGIVKKDPNTGYIKASVISEWEAKVNKALERMMIADEISGYEVVIDPKQLPTEQNPLKVQAKVVKDGIVHEFDVDLGLVNSI